MTLTSGKKSNMEVNDILSKRLKIKWRRVWEEYHISGYVSACETWTIDKNVDIEHTTCVTDEQGSEKASSWSLFRGKTFVEDFSTLAEAKMAAERMRLDEIAKGLKKAAK